MRCWISRKIGSDLGGRRLYLAAICVTLSLWYKVGAEWTEIKGESSRIIDTTGRTIRYYDTTGFTMFSTAF